MLAPKAQCGAANSGRSRLYVFTGGTDGLYSYSNLVFARGGIYGTTQDGGANGMGVVFEIAP